MNSLIFVIQKKEPYIRSSIHHLNSCVSLRCVVVAETITSTADQGCHSRHSSPKEPLRVQLAVTHKRQ